MDETIFLFAEEWDWCYRIKKAGWRIVYSPIPKVIHVGSASWTLTNAKRVRAILSSQHYFYRKHYGRVRAGLLKLSLLIDATIKIVLWMALYAALPSRRAYLRERCRWNLHALMWCLSGEGARLMQARDLESRPQPRDRTGAPP
jgi:GT2 family glycosyltransferase